MQKDKSTSCKADKKEYGVQKEKAKSGKGKKRTTLMMVKENM